MTVPQQLFPFKQRLKLNSLFFSRSRSDYSPIRNSKEGIWRTITSEQTLQVIEITRD